LGVKLARNTAGARRPLAGYRKTPRMAAGPRVGASVRRHLMAPLLIGYARVSTAEQDLTVQREALAALGVSA
jgi:hypothetical protein